MSDENVIKALECCTYGSCEDCPMRSMTDCFKTNLDKAALDLINHQKAENTDLFYKLTGVMHSVDKWLDGDELNQDEVNRAITMREKTLQITEKQQAEIERLQKEEKALLITVEKMRNEIRRLQNILVNFMDEIYEWGNKNNVDTNIFAQIAVLGNEKDIVVTQIKAEAIKEFWERLKLKKAALDSWVVYIESGDNLVNELTQPTKIEHNSLCETETYKE